MAKKKSTAPKKGKVSDAEKALAGLEKTAKELNLHIKVLKKVKGHGFLSGGTRDGHTFTS
jgi:hypothetical protein